MNPMILMPFARLALGGVFTSALLAGVFLINQPVVPADPLSLEPLAALDLIQGALKAMAVDRPDPERFTRQGWDDAHRRLAGMPAASLFQHWHLDGDASVVAVMPRSPGTYQVTITSELKRNLIGPLPAQAPRVEVMALVTGTEGAVKIGSLRVIQKM